MTAEPTPTGRRAALRLALDAADRACQERQALARKIADAADAAAARGMIVALDYAIDAEQAAEDALGARHEQRPDPRPAASAPPASPPPAATTSSPTAAPAAAEPPSGLALPAHWHNGGWSFLDPGDCRVAAEHGIPQWFPAEDQCAVAAMVKEKTGRTLLCFDPPKKEKKPRKPRAKGAGPGQTSAGIPADPAPEPRPLARYVCEGCGVEGECSPAGEPTPPLCYQCRKAREDANEGNGFLPGFGAPAKTPTATDERM